MKPENQPPEILPQKPLDFIQAKRRRLQVERTYYQHKLEGVISELARLDANIESIAEKQFKTRATLPTILEPLDYISPNRLRSFLKMDVEDDPR